MFQEICSVPSAEDAAEQETCTRTVGAGEGASRIRCSRRRRRVLALQYTPSVTVRRDTVRTEVKQPSATCSVQFSVLQVVNNDL